MSKEKLLAIIKDIEKDLASLNATIPIFGLVIDEAVRVETDKLQLQLKMIDLTNLKELVAKL